MIIKKPFYFVRHGQTDWNARRIIMGQADVPLNEQGIAQALALKNIVEVLPIGRIFHSPLQRAAQTAELIAQNLEVPKMTLDALREMHLGHYSGMERDRFPGPLGIGFCPPGGESWDQFVDRVCSGINEILNQSSHEHVLFVSHGGVFDVLCHVLEIKTERLTNCQLVYFEPLGHKGWIVRVISK